jgi:hypothetical protein
MLTTLVGITIALLQTVLSLTVDHSLFLSTLLTVDYFRLHPTIHCWLSALVVSSLANYSLTADFLFCHSHFHFQLPSQCLKKGLAGLKWRHPPPYCSYMHCNGLVTGETSVVHFTLHSSGFILGIANRCYGYRIRNHLSIEWQRHRFLGIRLLRRCCSWNS